MNQIKAIKNTSKLCWKCLKEHDEINNITINPLGYGSIFDGWGTRIQLCKSCYENSDPRIWTGETLVRRDVSEYKHDQEMWSYVQSLPIVSQQFVENEFSDTLHKMKPQDWINNAMRNLHQDNEALSANEKNQLNLYEIRFKHYSQKDSEEGICSYLVAQSDIDVYEWIKSDPILRNQQSITTSWIDEEDDSPEFKERIINCCGEMYDEESEVCDLYYGAIQHGWLLVKENISKDDINHLKEMNISIEETGLENKE